MKTEGTVKYVAQLLGYDKSWVRALCGQGRITGARKVGRDWIIPCPPKVLDKPMR